MDKEKIKFIKKCLKHKCTFLKIGLLLGCSKQMIYETAKKHNLIIKKKYIGLGGRDSVREKIRIRDNHTCQLCGKVWKKGQRKFDVHHKDEKKEKTRQCDNYEKEKDNMITLCHKCHLNIPGHKKSMSNGQKVINTHPIANKL